MKVAANSCFILNCHISSKWKTIFEGWCQSEITFWLALNVFDSTNGCQCVPLALMNLNWRSRRYFFHRNFLQQRLQLEWCLIYWILNDKDQFCKPTVDCFDNLHLFCHFISLLGTLFFYQCEILERFPKQNSFKYSLENGHFFGFVIFPWHKQNILSTNFKTFFLKMVWLCKIEKTFISKKFDNSMNTTFHSLCRIFPDP